MLAILVKILSLKEGCGFFFLFLFLNEKTFLGNFQSKKVKDSEFHHKFP